MIVSVAKATEAAEVLGVELTGLASSALARAYRGKTKECHPDHHGNTKLDQWARVSWAKECLEHWLAHHPSEPEQSEEPQGEGNCRACKGTGRVHVKSRRFGSPLTMACVICRGLGTVIPEESDVD